MTGPFAVDATVSIAFADYPDITFTCGTLADAERLLDSYRSLGFPCAITIGLRALIGDAARTES